MRNRKTLLPCIQWLQQYNRSSLAGDLIAAIIVTIMLVPQSLAYAMLAGLPPEVGLYASMLPLVAYALFGTSRTLAVGPVAVVSLLTAAAVGQVATAGSPEYVTAAITLTFLSGLMLLGMGFLRLGFFANFLAHPVISGFITASGILIAASQLQHILGVEAQGESLYQMILSLARQFGAVNGPTVIVGVGVLVFLFWARRGLQPLLIRLGMRERAAALTTKTGPVLAVILSTLAAYLFGLEQQGVSLVGDLPQGLPSLVLPSFDGALWRQLVGSALLLSIIGFVESVSVGHTLAAKRRQRIDPNQELIGLGAANTASAVSGGMPVTGGFSRSVVNFDSGAQTPAAGVFSAVGIALVALFLTPLLFYLPKATLAATIIVAVLSLVDLNVVQRAWRYSRSDFAAVITTILVTLLFGVELGVLAGVSTSIALHLYKTSRPHIAVVGELPGTEHFRNVKRHSAITFPHIVSVRVDESLYFANASYLQDEIYRILAENPDVSHIVIMCTAVNEIDMSALEALEAINTQLAEQGVQLHLSEVKGPVMDGLRRSDFLEHLSGQVFLSQHQAVQALKHEPERAESAEEG